MFSSALLGVRTSAPFRSTSGRLGQPARWTRLMGTTTQEVPNTDSTAVLSSAATTIKKKATHGRNVKRRPGRAPISNAQPREWCRPLGPGAVPAYDHAIELIKADSAKISSEAEILRSRIQETEEQRREMVAKQADDVSDATNVLDVELEAMRSKLRILEVQSEINLPDVRWRVANAMADMNKPVDRHLLEQRWRKEGNLDLLMERLYQMRVVPDLLSDLRPSIEVRLTANTLGMVPDKSYQVVEPGSFLLPRQTFDPPKIYVNAFHTDTRLYTLVLIDADVPDESNASFTTYLHWMQPNISLSANHTSRLLNLNNHTKYIPPHPQQGTKYHRYTLFLLQQPPLDASKYTLNAEARAQGNEPTSVHLDIPVVTDEQRKGFHLRTFMREWGFDMRQGGGVHMWREVWDKHVSTIYKDKLQIPEPRYGRPRKPDPYASFKASKRYIS